VFVVFTGEAARGVMFDEDGGSAQSGPPAGAGAGALCTGFEEAEGFWIGLSNVNCCVLKTFLIEGGKVSLVNSLRLNFFVLNSFLSVRLG
jgi:hypothetical protein